MKQNRHYWRHYNALTIIRYKYRYLDNALVQPSLANGLEDNIKSEFNLKTTRSQTHLPRITLSTVIVLD